MINYTEKLKEIFTNRYHCQHTPWSFDDSLDYTTVFAFNKLTKNRERFEESIDVD